MIDSSDHTDNRSDHWTFEPNQYSYFFGIGDSIDLGINKRSKFSSGASDLGINKRSKNALSIALSI